MKYFQNCRIYQQVNCLLNNEIQILLLLFFQLQNIVVSMVLFSLNHSFSLFCVRLSYHAFITIHFNSLRRKYLSFHWPWLS